MVKYNLWGRPIDLFFPKPFVPRELHCDRCSSSVRTYVQSGRLLSWSLRLGFINPRSSCLSSTHARAHSVQFPWAGQQHCSTPALSAYHLADVFFEYLLSTHFSPCLGSLMRPWCTPSRPSLRSLFRFISSSVPASHQPPSPPVAGLHGRGFILLLLRTDALDFVITYHSVKSVINNYYSFTCLSWLNWHCARVRCPCLHLRDAVTTVLDTLCHKGWTSVC